MANVGPSAVVTSLKRTLGSIAEATVPDSGLLDRFVTNGDQDAFAALVHRHGPMVLAVCRRVCGDEHLADDAFQAAFLVLARRAGDVKPRDAVRAWLYGVAVRTARGARVRSVRRRFREVPMPLVPDGPMPAAVGIDSDALQMLDEEIARLPQHLRTAVLLCELDGLPRKEAAARLGIPEGTLSSRLGKARKLLARRLRGRGIALSAGALTTLFGSARSAASVGPVLAEAAMRLAQAGPVSQTVATLSREVFRMMLLNKLKYLALLVVLVATVGSATLWQARNLTWADDPPAKQAPAAAQPSPQESEEAAEARSIINKAIQAQGGEANLAKQKIVRQKGTYRRFTDGKQGTPLFSWEQITQLPDRAKNIQKGEIDGQQVSMTIVLKGDQGWMNMDGQVDDLDKQMIVSMKEDLYASEISLLLPLKQKNFQLSVLAEQKVNGHSAAGVRVVSKGHPDVSLYFDKESALLVKCVRQVPDGSGGQITQEEFFSDYKETDKVKLPRKLITFADGNKIAEGTIEEVQFLQKIEEKEFDKPGSPPDKSQQQGQREKAQDAASPLARPWAQQALQQEKRQATNEPEDLNWRPAKVAGPSGRYLVLVDSGKGDEFLPAAEAMASLHGADLKRFDPAELDRTLAELRKAPPRFVIFVLPPEKIDVDLSHAILEMATKVDDDPFVDFEYGFITGHDGAAALRFVKRIERAWQREAGDKAMLFGSWEGPYLPSGSRMTGMKALGFAAQDRYVKATDAEQTRLKAARQILADCTGNDALLFMSHGYPDRMDLCFRAKDLREWRIDLSPAILFNCACFNGAPGRWFEPTGRGYKDRGIVARDDSVALALLDSGIAGYFAGVDAWHGPLTSQVFYYVTDDGMRLGEAANAMFNRLALEFSPGRIHYEPTLKRKRNSNDWWVQNQRDNGAAMILYGDPALAPFAKRAKHLLSARAKATGKDSLSLTIEVRPLLAGAPGNDFSVLPVNRLYDYYSLRADPDESPPQLELYRVVSLPAGSGAAPALRVVAAKSGDKDIPTGTVQLAVEDTRGGKLLHVRVPLQVSISDKPRDNLRLMALAKQGLVVELEGSRADDPPAKSAPVPVPAAVPKPAGPGHILYGRDGKLFLMDPDGKNERQIELPPMKGPPPVTCLSPDGRSLAFWTSGDDFQPVVCVRALDGTGFGSKFELKEAAGFVRMFWSPDGQELHVNLGGPAKQVRHFRIDLKTRQVSRLNVLKRYMVSDQSRDGKSFLAYTLGSKDGWNSKTIHLVTPAGTEEKLLADLDRLADPDGWVEAARLAPDGRRALVTHNGKPCVIDIDKPGVLKPVAGIPKDAEVPACAWAPDGKHIVYVIGTVQGLAPEDLKNFESRLIVADPDGGNAKVVRSEKGKMLTGVDWR